MKIPIWNWDTQRFDEPEYPEALFQPFLTWLLTTRRWLEDPELINRKVLALQRAMAEHRQPAQTHRETDAPLVPELTPAEAVAAKRRASLVKARAARKAKKEAALAEV
jgi:hypothetical protein